ncbi:MAG TPA: NAD(P)/FAD-dependent oxidoreductase [Pseudolysinimonas sp.]|nr:NAD(P)/FAD-dependent oxidoreductase [Pseudolysinimonas sp.]
MVAREYDLIVIGAGAVGENVADYATKGGLTAVIVEAELVGGECSYWACMPSKGLLRAGAAVRAARAVDGAKQAVTGEVDPAGAFARRTVLTHNWDDTSQADWLASVDIDLVRGHAHFTGERAVTVSTPEGDVELTARHAVTVSTGSDPLMPDIPGLAGIDPWTSRNATSATEAPGSLAILGGGVVGCEMATAYASFGTKVTMIVRGDTLLAGQEPFAREAVQASLEKAGVSIRMGVEVTKAHRTESNAVLDLSDGSRVVAAQVLVATGRTPRTHGLGLEAIGLTSGAWLDVDDTLRVKGYDWLYATGDVNHRALLTHQGKYQARAAGDVIAARAAGRHVDDAKWGRHVASADHEVVPQVTFTDPEVASVGLTAEAAGTTGRSIRVIDYDLSWIAGASAHADDYEGRARAVIDEDRQVLLGVTFVGPDVAEMIQAATIAIVAEVPLSRLWHAVPAYPTVNEVWLRFLETYGREESA